MKSGITPLLVLLVLIISPNRVAAQFTEAIEDNSFFIEEAYNQEKGVVQHITTALFHFGHAEIEPGFTQEWPVWSETHQLSYSLPYSIARGSNGMGDILLHYRYQLVRNIDGWAVSPRFSVSIPTGTPSKGRGAGSAGYQINIPVSKRWSNAIVTHFNLGTTLLPHLQNPSGTTRSTLDSYFAGGSLVYVLRYEFNILVEALHTLSKSFSTNGGTEYSGETIISPGIRCAIDIEDLQIVSGIAFPLQYARGTFEGGLFTYFSVEHFF